MLASGAHVKLGDHEFMVDESVDEHYVHHFQELGEAIGDVPGDPGKRQINPDKLVWTMTDWSGGEGNRIYYPDDPTVYEFSDGLNGRIAGQLTGRPARHVETVTWADQRDRPVLAVADGKLWLGGSENLYYTEDGDTVTSKTSGLAATDYRITAMIGDHEYIYYSAHHTAASGTRKTRRASVSGAAEDVEAEGTGRAPFAGMAFLQGRLYVWTGRRLFEWDAFESMPLAADRKRKVYDTGVDPASGNVFHTSWWANAFATENSVVFWYSTAGMSNVYEYRNGVGRPIWRPPYGFSIKGATYQNGVLFFSGHWGTDNNAGLGCMYALPMDTMRPLFLGWFRKTQNLTLQMQEMAGSWGSQILVAAAGTGRVFIYDADFDAISMLEDIAGDSATFTDNDHRIGDMITWGRHRYAAVYRPGASGAGTDIQLIRWNDDEPANRITSVSGGYSADLESGKWDNGYPFELKILWGVHVTFEPLGANQRITVSYSIDGNSYVSFGTITSATAGNSQGRVFLPLTGVGSDTKKYYNLKIKVTLDTNSTASVQPPILNGISPESTLANYREVWDVLVRLKEEDQDNARPVSRAESGDSLRDYLFDVMDNKQLITFLDGYRYRRQPDRYSSHVVKIAQIDDTIEGVGEGTALVRLVAIGT